MRRFVATGTTEAKVGRQDEIVRQIVTILKALLITVNAIGISFRRQRSAIDAHYFGAIPATQLDAW